MPLPSPTIAHLELATMIQTRRRTIGRDAKTIFNALGISRNHLSAIENARALPTEEALADLARILEFDTADSAYLLSLLQIARRREWWEDFARYVSGDVLKLCGLEHGAEQLRVYDPMVVTGLLQTEEYARAVIGANPERSRRIVERSVELRIRRQQRLHQPDPLHLTIVQGETSITQEIGGRDVLRRQLHHIAGVVEETEATLDYRILPFATTPPGFGAGSTLVLLDFPTSHLKTLAWAASALGDTVTDDSDVVETLELIFDLALSSCLSRTESLDLVRRRASEL